MAEVGKIPEQKEGDSHGAQIPVEALFAKIGAMAVQVDFMQNQIAALMKENGELKEAIGEAVGFREAGPKKAAKRG